MCRPESNPEAASLVGGLFSFLQTFWKTNKKRKKETWPFFGQTWKTPNILSWSRWRVRLTQRSFHRKHNLINLLSKEIWEQSLCMKKTQYSLTHWPPPSSYSHPWGMALLPYTCQVEDIAAQRWHWLINWSGNWNVAFFSIPSQEPQRKKIAHSGKASTPNQCPFSSSVT